MSADALSGPEDCNCLAVRQAARHITQFYDQFLAASGLRTTQFSLLHRSWKIRCRQRSFSLGPQDDPTASVHGSGGQWRQVIGLCSGRRGPRRARLGFRSRATCYRASRIWDTRWLPSERELDPALGTARPTYENSTAARYPEASRMRSPW
jgi:hypothetical protein